MSDPNRPKPYQPRGALDGCVIDSTMAKNMSFELIYGNSCGTPFMKDKFCDQHRQWEYLRPYLFDRPTQPWTVFSITKHHTKPDHTHNKKIKKYSNYNNNMKKTKKLSYNSNNNMKKNKSNTKKSLNYKL